MAHDETRPHQKAGRSKQKSQRQGRTSISLSESRKLPISVNVYDLMPQSRLSSFMWFTGLSICHSGVVIDDREWAFGGHDVEGVTGVYVTKPRAVPENAVFRVSIPLAVTILSDGAIRDHLNRLKKEYTGPSYDLLNKNCNHFVQDVCMALCGVTPPAWINRIAGLGSKLPLCVSEAWVTPPVGDLDDFEDEDIALLLPPSEIAPMSRNSDHVHDDVGTPESDDESLNDAYLTQASDGLRLNIGSK